MKILHLITDLDIGGAEMMLYNLLKIPPTPGTMTSVVSLIDLGIIGSRIQQLSIPVKSLGMHSGRPDLRALWRLVIWLRRDPPDLMQTWMYHADLLGGVAARLAGNMPVIWGIHHTLGGEQPLQPRTMAVLRLNAILSNWMPRRVICCAETACDAHEQVGYSATKMIVIPNGVDTERFHPDKQERSSVRQELSVTPDTRLIGMFARFHPQKDHHTFIEAARLLHAKLPHVHFVLGGDGMTSLNDPLQDWIRTAELSSHVHLLGLRQDIPRLMAAMDIVSLSSSFGEALPLVIAEAMACGIPAVVTDVGDASRLVGITGRIVPTRDPVALSNAWEELIRLPEHDRSLLGQKARSRIEQEYNIVSIAERYYSLYKSVLVNN